MTITPAPTTLVDVFTTGAMTATARICHDKGMSPNVDDLTLALKAAGPEQYHKMVADLKDALYMGEPIQRQIINSYCVETAIMAVRAVGAMPAAPAEKEA